MRTARTKFFAVLLSLSMLVSLLVVPVSAAEFTDVPDWATGAVDRWTEAGIMEGGSDGTFDATHKMTRGEFAILMCKLMGYTEESDRSTFTDLPEDAAVASALLKLHKAGVLLGVAEGVAAPDSTLTREQTAVIMFRALGMKANPNAPAMTFGDADQVSDWAQDAVKTMTALHMLEGDGTNVTPKVDIPKQDMACLLDKMVAVYVDNSGKVSTTTTTSATNKTVAAQTKNGTTTINAADHPGAVIVKASKVTIESAASSGSIMVAPGAAKNAAVTVTGAASDITVAAEGAKVTVSKTGEVDNITMSAANTQASISGKVDSVAVESGADSAKLTVAKGAEVTDVAVEAPKAAVTVSGTVGSVDIAASADNTTVKATTGAKVDSVTTSADGVKIDGANKTIGSVVADAGSAEVKAKGAEVSNDGAEVKVDGKPVTEGNTTTSNQTGSGTSTGGGTTSGGGTVTPPAEEKVTVTFDVNTPDGATAPTTPDAQEITKGGKLTTLPTLTLDGYTFNGWFTEKTDGTKITTDTTFDANTTIYAQWTEEVVEKVTVTFDVNAPDGTTAPTTPDAQEITKGGMLTTLPTLTLDGYTFNGWFTAKTDGIQIAADTTFDADTTVYAQWTEGVVEKITVTFDVNAPAGATAPTTPADREIIKGSKLTTLPTLTLDGYTFNGWFTAKTDGTKITTDTTFDANTTVYAQWTEEVVEKVTVTFDVNAPAGATAPTAPAAQEITKGGKLTTLPTLTLDGYTFDGWFTAKTDGTKITTDTTFDANTTVYAQWTEEVVEKITVTFDVNAPAGATAPTAPAAQEITKGGKLTTLPTLELDKYTLIGWFTEATGGTEITADTTFSTDTTAYARWSKLSTVSVIAMTADEYPSVMPMLFGQDKFPDFDQVAVVTGVNGDKLTITHTEGADKKMPYITNFVAFNKAEVAEQSGYYILVTFHIDEPDENVTIDNDTVVMTMGDKEFTYASCIGTTSKKWEGNVAIMYHISADSIDSATNKYTGNPVVLCTVDLDGDGDAYAPMTYTLDYSGLTFSGTDSPVDLSKADETE